MQDDIAAIKVSSMSDEQKKQYERERELEEAQNWKNTAIQLQQSIQEKQVASDYIEYFRSIGVPDEKLVTTQGLDNLVNSGWAGLQEVMTQKDTKIKELEAKMLGPLSPTTQPTTESQQPPRVPITQQQISTNTGTSYDELATKYGGGSLDEVFRKIERGELPASVLPG